MIVKCAGRNDNNLSFNQFQQLFIYECHLIGKPLQVMNINRNILIALVEDGK